MESKIVKYLFLLGLAMPFAGRAEVKESVVKPVRIVWMSDTTGKTIKGADVLLKDFSGQVSVNNSAQAATLKSTSDKKASILLDFGKEMYGGLKLYTGMPKDQGAKHVRVVLGESVSEAMSDVNIPNNPQNPTNEHSLRDFTLSLPWLGSAECGKSGFRFARIDYLDTIEPLKLRYVEGRSFMIDDPEIGSFECSDPLLNEIWNTGAYTVKLNMQDYVWDGIKRDRLVWLGDMHPEVMSISSIWGEMPVVNRTLDYAADDTPLPGWINGMCSYSIWWMIIHRDLYMRTGNLDYLREQQPYIRGLVDQIDALVDEDGTEHLDGVRFLDWPTSESKDIIDSGMLSMTYMGMQAARDMARYLDDEELAKKAENCLRKLGKRTTPNCNNKQAAALAVISGLSKNPAEDVEIIEKDGCNGYSTFYGYYMLEALAKQGKYKEAMQRIADYWGAMLDLGATTFWEEFTYSDAGRAGRIDEFVPEGKYDIHADGGAYCYKGLRQSLCHGWASGPTAWMTTHILGVKPLEPGCSVLEIKPNLGDLEWARGSFPTPKGAVRIEVRKGADGKQICTVGAPKGIRIKN